MISYVEAFSLQEARELFRRRDTWDRVIWIGFEPAAPSPVRKIQGLYARVFEVADVELDKLPEWMAADDPRIPSIDHARQIVSVLRMAHEKPEPWCVYVHCTAGISRSGAVSLHTRETYGSPSQTDREYLQSHMRCIPNASILRLLRAAEDERSTVPERRSPA